MIGDVGILDSIVQMQLATVSYGELVECTGCSINIAFLSIRGSLTYLAIFVFILKKRIER